jgi:hypothetical protein
LRQGRRDCEMGEWANRRMGDRGREALIRFLA